MKKVLYLFFALIPGLLNAQENNIDLEKVIRINLLSPGVEYEHPLSFNSAITTNVGITIPGSYPNQDIEGSGFFYYIAPFLDLSYKRFYNREKRLAKEKSLAYNSGNYWSIRLLSNFKEIHTHNVTRTDNISFAFGPTWGLQRAYGKMHFLFDLGPVYYFDTKANNGFFPIMLQLNIGFNAKKW